MVEEFLILGGMATGRDEEYDYLFKGKYKFFSCDVNTYTTR